MKESKKELRQSKEIRVGSRRNFSLARKSGRRRMGGHPSCNASSVNCGQNLGIASTKFSRGGRMSKRRGGVEKDDFLGWEQQTELAARKENPRGKKPEKRSRLFLFLSLHTVLLRLTHSHPLSACAHTSTLWHHQHNIPPPLAVRLSLVPPFPFSPAAPARPPAVICQSLDDVGRKSTLALPQCNVAL